MHRDAHAAITDAERLVLDINSTKKPELAQVLQGMLERLRELLAREPDNVASIKTCMEDLRKVRLRYQLSEQLGANVRDRRRRSLR